MAGTEDRIRHHAGTITLTTIGVRIVDAVEPSFSRRRRRRVGRIWTVSGALAWDTLQTSCR